MPLALLADALRVRRRGPPRVQYCSFGLISSPACSSSLIYPAMFSLTFLMSAPAAALVFIASRKFFSVRFHATPWSAYGILQPHA